MPGVSTANMIESPAAADAAASCGAAAGARGTRGASPARLFQSPSAAPTYGLTPRRHITPGAAACCRAAAASSAPVRSGAVVCLQAFQAFAGYVMQCMHVLNGRAAKFCMFCC